MDGDLDAVVVNDGAQVNRLFLNGGKGSFAEAPSGVFRAALGGGVQVVLGDVDLDGDGDLDLVLAAFWGGCRVLRNLRSP